MEKLFSSLRLGSLELKNRVVMSPMTRCRAIGNVANDIMAEYYSIRSSAGLLITEATSVSPNGLGYARIPGMFNDEHVAGWNKVTSSVHEANGSIFLQLFHSGRISHPLNMPEGTRVLAPSAITPAGEMWTDQLQLQPFPAPEEMTAEDIKTAVEEFLNACRLADKAGFDGVEFHCANGYLIDQFINPTTNQRDDEYGGSIENRLRFALDIVRGAVEILGEDRIGIRLSPYGVFNDMGLYDEIEETYSVFCEALDEMEIGYVHIVDHSSIGAPEVTPAIKALIREKFQGAVILAGGYDAKRAETDLNEGKGDLVAFGRPFITNPDLVDKMKSGAPLLESDELTYYTVGKEGYLEFPV